MASIMSLKVDEARMVVTLQEIGSKLESTVGDVIVDFSDIRRVDPAALEALTEFVDTADEKAVNVVLRGVSVDVYRVLKLARLAKRFSLVS
jgi:anti-anti-sigma regulatory factor